MSVTRIEIDEKTFERRGSKWYEILDGPNGQSLTAIKQMKNRFIISLLDEIEHQMEKVADLEKAARI